MFSDLYPLMVRTAVFAWTALLLSTSVPRVDFFYRIRLQTDTLRFNFSTWTADALWFKMQQASLGMPGYLSREARKQVVDDYFRLTEDLLRLDEALNTVFSDPQIKDPQSASALLRARREQLVEAQAQVQLLTEAVLEAQIAAVVVDEGLTLLGQPLPPVLAHITPLPYDLVLSPRDRIEQTAAVMLRPDLTVDDFETLEAGMEARLGVSALVVPVGGVGTYPTMVQRTANLSWTVETFAHEWIHNYLGLHPLGRRYSDTAALRTMNETTASLAGKSIRDAVLQRFYPERLPPTAHQQQMVNRPLEHPDPRDWPRPGFDLRAELHTTRVVTDALLAEGRIDEAEAYMEARRQFFWQMGYRLRKLNQAYFAFYGAYAARPGGAAGEDPVGAAVRELYARSPSLGDFVRTMSELRSFDDLQTLLNVHTYGGNQDETLVVFAASSAFADRLQPGGHFLRPFHCADIATHPHCAGSISHPGFR